jgi:hypothetical protein
MQFPDADFPALQHQVPTHPSRHPPGRRAHQKLLAQPNKRARPMARHPLNINDVATHHIGGAEGIRTPDPLHAMQVRYQLRHSPDAFDWLESNLIRLLHTKRSPYPQGFGSPNRTTQLSPAPVSQWGQQGSPSTGVQASSTCDLLRGRRGPQHRRNREGSNALPTDPLGEESSRRLR